MRISSRRIWLVGGALAALTLVSACANDGYGARYAGAHLRAGSGFHGGYGAPSSR